MPVTKAPSGIQAIPAVFPAHPFTCHLYASSPFTLTVWSLSTYRSEPNLLMHLSYIFIHIYSSYIIHFLTKNMLFVPDDIQTGQIICRNNHLVCKHQKVFIRLYRCTMRLCAFVVIWHRQVALSLLIFLLCQDVAYIFLIHLLLNGPRQANLVRIAYASSEGSGEPAHPRSLARTFAARSYKQ